MLTFDVSVSGGQVGHQLQNDPEEFAYALAELADGFTEKLAADVIGQLPYGKADEVKAMLQAMILELEKPF